MRRELVGLDRVLEGADLAALSRLAERRDLADLWSLIVAGVSAGPTVGELLEAADRRGRRLDAIAFLLGVGLVLEQLPDDDCDGKPCPGCSECEAAS